MTLAGVKKSAVLKPIMDENITDVAVFLNRHMNGRFSSEEWERGLRAGWWSGAPNHGFMLKSDDGVVGVICALYSQQFISESLVSFCNPHSWCVLEPYRGKSVQLVLALIRQVGFNYTMFSPNKEGEEIFAYLGFKPLDREMRILANIPLTKLSGEVETTAEFDLGTKYLSSQDMKCIEDHRDFRWLHFLFFSRNGEYGFTIYKRERFKRLPCAKILYINNKELFESCWTAIRTHLLLKHRLFTTRLERRLANADLPLCIETTTSSAKFFLSENLPPEAIHYTYSELVAMDL